MNIPKDLLYTSEHEWIRVDGDQVYLATGIAETTDLAVIKEPTGKKKYTQEEFKIERDKMLEEMNRNNGGGNRRVIRMN